MRKVELLPNPGLWGWLRPWLCWAPKHTASKRELLAQPRLGEHRAISKTIFSKEELSVHTSIALLLRQWHNFAWGCPWARDDWVPHWLRSAWAKCKKSKRATFESLTTWGPEGGSPRKLLFFKAETAFSTQTYKLKIVKFIGLGTGGGFGGLRPLHILSGGGLEYPWPPQKILYPYKKLHQKKGLKLCKFSPPNTKFS